MERIYAKRTPLAAEMLELAPAALNLPVDASTPARMEAWLVYARTAYQREVRARAYEELADLEQERLAAIQAANLDAAANGLL